MINAGSISGMATQLSSALKKRGYTAGQVRDRESGDPSSTTIQYGAGAETDAANVATLLGVDAAKQPDPSIAPGHIRVTVDTNFSLPAVEETTTTDDYDHDTVNNGPQSQRLLLQRHVHDVPDARSGQADRRRRSSLRQLPSGVRSAVDADLGAGDERAVLGHQHGDNPGDH